MADSNRIRNTEEAHIAVQKLDAMAIAISGEGFDQFSTMSKDRQHWYLAVCLILPVRRRCIWTRRLKPDWPRCLRGIKKSSAAPSPTGRTLANFAFMKWSPALWIEAV